ETLILGPFPFFLKPSRLDSALSALSCLVLSRPAVLPCPILSYPTLSCPDPSPKRTAAATATTAVHGTAKPCCTSSGRFVRAFPQAQSLIGLQEHPNLGNLTCVRK